MEKRTVSIKAKIRVVPDIQTGEVFSQIFRKILFQLQSVYAIYNAAGFQNTYDYKSQEWENFNSFFQLLVQIVKLFTCFWSRAIFFVHLFNYWGHHLSKYCCLMQALIVYYLFKKRFSIVGCSQFKKALHFCLKSRLCSCSGWNNTKAFRWIPTEYTLLPWITNRTVALVPATDNVESEVSISLIHPRQFKVLNKLTSLTQKKTSTSKTHFV